MANRIPPHKNGGVQLTTKNIVDMGHGCQLIIFSNFPLGTDIKINTRFTPNHMYMDLHVYLPNQTTHLEPFTIFRRRRSHTFASELQAQLGAQLGGGLAAGLGIPDVMQVDGQVAGPSGQQGAAQGGAHHSAHGGPQDTEQDSE